jgi:hypothetical protein
VKVTEAAGAQPAAMSRQPGHARHEATRIAPAFSDDLSIPDYSFSFRKPG